MRFRRFYLPVYFMTDLTLVVHANHYGSSLDNCIGFFTNFKAQVLYRVHGDSSRDDVAPLNLYAHDGIDSPFLDGNYFALKLVSCTKFTILFLLIFRLIRHNVMFILLPISFYYQSLFQTTILVTLVTFFIVRIQFDSYNSRNETIIIIRSA